MKVLYIAWGFPPMGGNGIQRTLKFVKYLPQNGVEVIVLASSDSKQGNLKDEKLLKEIPPSVRVYHIGGAGWISGLLRIRDKAKGTVRGGTADSGGKRGLLALLLKALMIRAVAPAWRFLLNTLMVPDLARPWARNAIRSLPDILKDHVIDLVYVTGPPFSAFLVAEKAAERAKVPLVLEYRDPWCIPSGRPSHGLKHLLEKRMEARIIRKAAKVVFDNPVSRQAHIGFYAIPPEKAHIIPNGYDPADKIDIIRERPDGPILFGYSGSFTSDGRTPRYFLEALAQVLGKHPEWKDILRAKFVGQFWPDDAKFIVERNLGSLVQTTGFLPHSECVKQVSAFDIALVIGETCKGNTNTVPEKIYEYIMLEKPILALVPREGASGRLILEHGLGEVTGVENVEAIAAGIERMVTGFRNGETRLAGNPATEKFDRRRLAAQLASTLKETVEGSQDRQEIASAFA
jgi:glycosyltransferase involved in cell wall biosynthesis